VGNEFIAEIVSRHPGRLVGFGKHDYGCRGREAALQIERAINEYDLRGVGEFALSEFYPTPPREVHRSPDLRVIMDKIADLRVPLLLHTGWSQAPFPLLYYDPLIIDEIADDFGDVRIIVGHAGQTNTYFFEGALMTALKHDNVYLELSHQPEKNVARAVDEVGAGKCLFGTDWGAAYPPIDSQGLYARKLNTIANLEITHSDKERILGKNIAGLLRIA
jgi:predicted TIM-barrel fold metal-dependent hydrolase